MKRLYRSQKNKVVAGVCGGIAEYFNIDPVLVRLAAVLLFFTGGASLIAYIVGMIIIPKEPLIGFPHEETTQASDAAPASADAPIGRNRAGSLIIGILLIMFGLHFLLRNIPFFYPFYWWFWDINWHYVWPSILVAAGLLIILRGIRK